MQPSCDLKDDVSDIVSLQTVTQNLKESLRFANIMIPKVGSDWQEIKTEKGKAFIRGLMKIDKIAVSDNYASAETLFPEHQHPAHEVFIVYDGKMVLNVSGDIINVMPCGKPYYFDARKVHSAYFPVPTSYIAATIPADDDWPDGG